MGLAWTSSKKDGDEGEIDLHFMPFMQLLQFGFEWILIGLTSLTDLLKWFLHKG